MADVFISYSRKDREFANQLVNALEKSKRDVWVDWQDIPRGEQWLNEIKSGIENADSFVFIVTRHSLTSEICNIEVEHARTQNKRIIPVMHEKIEGDTENIVKGQWLGKDWQDTATANWTALGHINWVFAGEDVEFESMFIGLVEAIETDYEHVKLHTRYGVRALDWERASENPSFLLTGDEITAAEDWLSASADKDPVPTELHQRFIITSRQVEDERIAESERMAQQARTFRRASLGLSLVAVIAVIATIIAGIIGVNASNQTGTATHALGQSIFQAETATHAQGQAIVDANNANTQQAQANQRLDDVENTIIPATLDAVATDVQDTVNFANSLQIASRARDIFDGGQLRLGLSLALEASYTDQNSQTTRTLSELAYSPGARYLYDDADVTDFDFSPDGETFVFSFADGTIHVRDLETNEIVQIFEAYPEDISINNIKFNPDGSELFTTTAEGTLVFRDATSGEILRNYELNSSIYRVTYNSNGSQVLIGSFDGIALYDVQTGELLRTYNGLDVNINSLAISPDDSLILAGGGDVLADTTGLALWDADTGEILHYFDDLRSAVQSVAFTPDGTQFIANDINVLVFRDVENGDIQQRISVHQNTITQIVFSPDASKIITASWDETVAVLDAETGEVLYHFFGHTNWVTDIAIHPDGSKMLSGISEVLMWDLEQANIVSYFRNGNWYPIYSIAFSSDGSQIISGGGIQQLTPSDRSYMELILWDTDSGDIQRRFESSGGLVRDAVFSADGLQILSGGGTILGFDDPRPPAELILWDATTGEEIRRYEGHTNAVYSVAFSPDGTKIASGSLLGETMIWDVESGEILHRLTEDMSTIFGVAFSPDGTKLLSVSTQLLSPSLDSELILWDVESGQILHRYQGHIGFIFSIAFSPDGTQILSGGGDIDELTAELFLWDVESGELLRKYEGHTSVISSVAFSPDASLILSGSDDNTVILWDSNSGAILFQYENDPYNIADVAFSPDGFQILTATSANFGLSEIILWRYDTIDQLHAWIADNRLPGEITCDQRIIYDLERCDDGIPPPSPPLLPTRTPFMIATSEADN